MKDGLVGGGLMACVNPLANTADFGGQVLKRRTSLLVQLRFGSGYE